MRSAPVILIAVLAACRTESHTALHPLAPLSAAEIRDAAQIIRPRVPDTARFSIIALDEPPKEIVLRQIPTPRRAFAILYDMDSNRTWEVIANLPRGASIAYRRSRTRSRWLPAKTPDAPTRSCAPIRGGGAPWRRAAYAT